MPTTIRTDEHNDLYVCTCGNTNDSDGFTGVTEFDTDRPKHTEGAPTVACWQCGNVMDSTTHRPAPEGTDPGPDDLTHVVTVVGHVDAATLTRWVNEDD